MKAIAIFFATLACSIIAFAQTNTFPASGNVGIGITNPYEKLQVEGNIILENGESASIYPVGHNLFFGGKPWWAHVTYTFRPSWGSPSSTFATIALQKADTLGNFTTAAQIASESGTPTYFVAGNVGIGTSVPSNKLTVAKAWNPIVDGFDGAPTVVVSGSAINSRSDSSVQQLLYLHQPNNGDGGYSKGTGFGIGLSFWEDPRNNYPRTRVDFQTTDRSSDTVSACNTVMSLRDDGNIGIGTANPNNKLTVSSALVDFGSARYSSIASGNGVVLNADAGGAGTASVGIEFGGNGVAHANLLWRPNERQFMFGTGNYPTDLSNPYGYAGLAVMGNVGIGTTNPTERLSVKGRIRAQEVVVDNNNWSDYVLAKNYKLAPLSEVEQHIQTQGHLPGVPSAQEVAEKGVSVGEMQAVLLAKIEELTLHQIAQEKNQSAQQNELAALRAEVTTLKAENTQLKGKTI